MKYGYIILVLLLAFIVFLTSCSGNEGTQELEKLQNDLEEEVARSQQLQDKVNEKIIELNAAEDSISLMEMRIFELEELIDLKENELDEVLKSMGPLPGNSLLIEAQAVLAYLANQDGPGLNSHVSPVNGLRFSPYSYINTATDLFFSQGSSISGLFTDPTIYTWGSYDGSGEPINLDFAAYYNEFIYDEDYLNPHMIGINTPIGSGNMINNITSAYPGASFVEFHFTGFDPQYEGLDWSSLILVFEDSGGTWYLIGIVHGQWTS